MGEVPGMNVSSLFPDRAPPPLLEIIGPYPGKVLENDDSSDEDGKLGRLKVWVPHLHGEEYEDRAEDLPWARPLGHVLAGKGEDGVKRGIFIVPLKDMWTYVFFERGDIDEPLWFGGWYGQPEGSPELPTKFQESDYGGQYPEIPGIVFPPFSLRLHGVETPQAATLKWGEDLTIEIDSTPWQNAEPTIALKVHNEDWKVKLESEGDVTLKTAKKLTLEAENLDVKVEEVLDIQCQGRSIFHSVGDSYFSSDRRIVGVAPKATGFEDH